MYRPRFLGHRIGIYAAVVHESKVWAQLSLSFSGSADSKIARPSQLQHAVEHVNTNLHFGRSLPIRMRPQPITDHSFPSGDGRLRARTRDCLKIGGVRPQPLFAGADHLRLGISVRSWNRASHCKRRSEPGAADRRRDQRICCDLFIRRWFLATFGDQAASRNLRSSRSNLARPYIWRLRVFSRLICPSVCPLLQSSDTAARTAS